MEGIISNYRRNRSRTYMNHIIIVLQGSKDKKDAEKLIGKKVVFKTETGKDINGEIAATHGNKGAVRAIFERGLPGQALGTRIQVE